MDSRQNDEQAYWFVMRDLKRSNAKQPAYKQLEDNGMEVFTPMKSCIKIKMVSVHVKRRHSYKIFFLFMIRVKQSIR